MISGFENYLCPSVFIIFLCTFKDLFSLFITILIGLSSMVV